MYGLGLSTKQIQSHLKEIEVSPELISRILRIVNNLRHKKHVKYDKLNIAEGIKMGKKLH